MLKTHRYRYHRWISQSQEKILRVPSDYAPILTALAIALDLGALKVEDLEKLLEDLASDPNSVHNSPLD